jgi:hypothetical protein
MQTGQQRAVTNACLFISERAFLYILADLQSRCYVHSAIVQVYEISQSKKFKIIIEIFQRIFYLFFCLTTPEAK